MRTDSARQLAILAQHCLEGAYYVALNLSSTDKMTAFRYGCAVSSLRRALHDLDAAVADLNDPENRGTV